jgi:hypothetical protein
LRAASPRRGERAIQIPGLVEIAYALFRQPWIGRVTLGERVQQRDQSVAAWRYF